MTPHSGQTNCPCSLRTYVKRIDLAVDVRECVVTVGRAVAVAGAEAVAVAATRDEVAATGRTVAALAISIIGFRKVVGT